MTKKYEILKKLSNNYLFAVVRGKDKEDGTNISNACIEGGLKNIEITYTTPDASSVISHLVKSVNSEEVVIGAGTILDDITARNAILAGAEFIVSPHFDSAISKICNRYSVPYLPGCATATEIIKALESGVDVVKLFPGGLLGASFIKDIHGPLPHVEMMPSGGVSLDNLKQWIENGAWGAGIGSALTKDINKNGYESVTIAANKFVDKMLEIKSV
ncbi:bifunctional 2-keto-4-hydroxyglutarate aldolase/2-keto-3-deoxy-6-phosphogluconate aldolase [Carnobacterium mobile]|uniref:bifunctional 2-keto-4-hydroxyglutarate aldolase/2-keto-3-deoxy-6-phosphogluconate aldolase n=1 Tax=Carnobacterium mobile TaxID=2750 RepID=UPI00055252A2|nr:bifunctional 2-keto-4-hydroxyglutarate aldolase/2-keto-3-deoxy-6-phosphogluconate aldolase [Carnobacterium mobile]